MYISSSLLDFFNTVNSIKIVTAFKLYSYLLRRSRSLEQRDAPKPLE